MNKKQKQFGVTQAEVFRLASEAAKNYDIPSVFRRTRAEDIWRGIENVLYRSGKDIHFKKHGDLPIMRTKQAERIIIPKIDKDNRFVITMDGFELMLLLVPNSDILLKDEYEALMVFMERPDQEAEAVRHMEETGEIVPVVRSCFIQKRPVRKAASFPEQRACGKRHWNAVCCHCLEKQCRAY